MVRYTYNQQVSPPAPFVHVSVRPPYEGAAGITVPAQISAFLYFSLPEPVQYR